MPVNQDAANAYERNATGDKWNRGVQGGDIEAGLANAGVSNVQGSGLQAEWERGVDGAQDDYEEGIDGSAWLSGMQDASDWNI